MGTRNGTAPAGVYTVIKTAPTEGTQIIFTNYRACQATVQAVGAGTPTGYFVLPTCSETPSGPAVPGRVITLNAGEEFGVVPTGSDDINYAVVED